MATRPTGAITQAKRERQDEPDGARPPKRQELSEHNLRLLQEMETAARPGSIEPSSSSWLSTAASGTTQAATIRSSGAYRTAHPTTPHLKVHVDLPRHIKDAANAIINVEPPQERLDQLNRISDTFDEGCLEAAREAAGDDDFVRLLQTALMEMKSTSLCLRENADWQVDPMSQWQRSRINLDFLTRFDFVDGDREQAVDGDQEQAIDGDQEQAIDGDQEQAIDGDQEQAVDDASLPPTERQHLSFSDVYISPMSSIANTPPNGLQDLSTMPKTPHSDVSIGLSSLALSSALPSQNGNTAGAKLFLTLLRTRMDIHTIFGKREQAPISVPALPASGLTFPFAVFEGNTGGRAYEAENQAAVSGASALEIQLDLDDLVECATSSGDNQSASSENQPPLFFSICTEGPIYKLWVHWTTMEDGARNFNMEIIKAYCGRERDDVEDFFIAVDNVLHWGVNQFANSVAERLGTVTGRTVSLLST